MARLPLNVVPLGHDGRVLFVDLATSCAAACAADTIDAVVALGTSAAEGMQP